LQRHAPPNKSARAAKLASRPPFSQLRRRGQLQRETAKTSNTPAIDAIPAPKVASELPAVDAEIVVQVDTRTTVAQSNSTRLIRPVAAERIVEGALATDENTRAYEQLATRVIDDVSCFPTACVGFVAADQGGDSTLVITILGNVLRRRQEQVLILDSDTEQRCLSLLHGVTDRPGTGDILSGSALLPESVLHTPQQIKVLPIGTAYESNERPSSKKWGQFLSQIKVQSPLTLIDLGTMQSAFSTQMAQLCETVYLVVAMDRTPRSTYAKLAGQIPLQGIRLQGTIVTL